MGYELEKLKRTYGVSSAAEPRYAGTEKPDKPVSTATTSQVDAYNKQMAKYLADQQAFKDYKRDYNRRVNNASIYTQSQFQPYMPNQQLNPADFAVSNAPTYTDRVNIPTFGRLPTASGGLSAARAEGGIGESQYLQNIKNALKTGTPEEVQTQFNATPYDISRARSWIDPTKYTDNKPTSSLGTPGAPSFNPFNLTLSPEVLASIRKATGQNFAHGGPVKMQGGGFMDNQYIMAPAQEQSNQPSLQELWESYQGSIGPGSYADEIKAAREKASSQQEELLKSLQNAAGSDAGSKAEMYFRLAAALGQPTRTGSIGETLGNVNQALAESSKAGRERQMAQRQLALEVQKIRAAGSKEDLNTLLEQAKEESAGKRQVVGELIRARLESLKDAGKPMSDIGKQARDAGLTPGTPEYTQFVKDAVEKEQARKGLQAENVTARLGEASARLAIAERDAELRRLKEEREAGKLDPQSQKLLQDTDETLNNIDTTLGALQEAYKKNANTYGGTWKDMFARFKAKAVNEDDPEYLATLDVDNLLTQAAAPNVKTIFGGNPAESESARALGLSGAGQMNKEQRDNAIRATVKMLLKKQEQLKKRREQIRSGSYQIKSSVGIPEEE